MAGEKLMPNVSDYPEVASMTTPAAGHLHLANLNGSMTQKDSSGVETDLAGGGGSFTSFTVAGDSGTPQTITDGNTLNVLGGMGLSSVASATDTVTVNLDTPVSIGNGGTNATNAANALANLSGAHNTLNNLGTTSVNADILPSADNTRSFGSTTLKWLAAWLYGLIFKERSAPSTPASGDFIAYVDTTGVAMGINDGAVKHTLSNVTARLRDQRASGTNGGTTSNATWNARPLNTEVSDPFGIVTISSDKATFVAGTFSCDVRAVAGAASGTGHRLRAFNVTAGTTIKEGITSASDGGQRKYAHLSFDYVSNGTDEIRIDHYTVTGVATTGLGIPLSIGTDECYMEIDVEKTA